MTRVTALALAISAETGQIPEITQDLLDKHPEHGPLLIRLLGIKGFTPGGRKVGLPPKPELEMVRRAYPTLSERSIARVDRGLRLLLDAGADGDYIQKVLDMYHRPRGGINAAVFERCCENLVYEWGGNG